MKFYLGTHIVNWLWNIDDVPLFISRRTFGRYKKIPQAKNDWALDSGGFTELNLHNGWTINAEQYATEVARLSQAGRMQWAAPQDWMCEPWIVDKTGLTVKEHIERTVLNFIELQQYDLLIIPVLQGWSMDDYQFCADQYKSYGIDLSTYPTVGLGSVCRRQATDEIGEITQWGFEQGYKLHGFGVKSAGLKKYSQYLTSADSLAWSFTGRWSPDPDCEKKTCANCLHYAMKWRDKVLASI